MLSRAGWQLLGLNAQVEWHLSKAEQEEWQLLGAERTGGVSAIRG
jgi:hypothetical protein